MAKSALSDSFEYPIFTALGSTFVVRIWRPQTSDSVDPRAVRVNTGAFSGMPWTPKAMSARILVSTMWIYYIILVSTYTGNLVAFLAVPNRIVPIDTLRDAVRQNTYAVGTIKGQALEDVLKVIILKIFWKLVRCCSNDSHAISNN